MTGYFSQLIKQTGISFPLTGNGIAPAVPALESSELTGPLEVNKERFVDTQMNQENNVATGKRSEHSAPPLSTTVGEGVRDLTEGNVEVEATTAKQKPPGRPAPAILVEEASSSTEAAVRFCPLPDFEVQLDEITVSATTKPQGQPSHPMPPAASAGAPEQASGRAGETRLREIHIEDVRAWLAGGREENTEIEVQREKASLRTEGLANVPKAREVMLDSARPLDEQESHEFQLSIGSINVTVEQPQKSLTVSPQPPRTERRLEPASSFSRLSRHYMRTR